MPLHASGRERSSFASMLTPFQRKKAFGVHKAAECSSRQPQIVGELVDVGALSRRVTRVSSKEGGRNHAGSGRIRKSQPPSGSPSFIGMSMEETTHRATRVVDGNVRTPMQAAPWVVFDHRFGRRRTLLLNRGCIVANNRKRMHIKESRSGTQQPRVWADGRVATRRICRSSRMPTVSPRGTASGEDKACWWRAELHVASSSAVGGDIRHATHCICKQVLQKRI